MRSITDNLDSELKEINEKKALLAQWHEVLASDDCSHTGADYKGWVRLPNEIDPAVVDKIARTAEEIRQKCSLLVVVGIGGSYLGAKAVIEALDGGREGYPEVVFAGFNMNGSYTERLLKRMERESVCLCVISKSGRTVEPLISYTILKDALIRRYGAEEADRRIYLVTDRDKGDLRPEAEEKGYTSFVIPDDIGGRYSVLTPVGLLPIAAAGLDIRALLEGAGIMQNADWSAEGGLLDYAAARLLLQAEGRVLEVFEFFEYNLRYFGEWLKQLFGETEGKDGRGAYPACLFFTRDLHSIGQFLQQGNQMFYETVIRIENPSHDVVIPDLAGGRFAGRTIEQINSCAEEGVIAAHRQAGIPINQIYVERLDEKNLGKMIYFFEMSAALSAYALGLNPFDQPGVEAYKKEMQGFIERL